MIFGPEFTTSENIVISARYQSVSWGNIQILGYDMGDCNHVKLMEAYILCCDWSHFSDSSGPFNRK